MKKNPKNKHGWNAQLDLNTQLGCHTKISKNWDLVLPQEHGGNIHSYT